MRKVKHSLRLLLRPTQLPVFVMVSLTWSLQAMAMDVRTEVADFFKVYLGRSLTAQELDEAVFDYQSFFGDPEHCNAACEKALASHVASRRLLVQSAGTPQALLLRPSISKRINSQSSPPFL